MAETHSSTSAVPQIPLCISPDVGALRAARQQLVVPSALEVAGDKKYAAEVECDGERFESDVYNIHSWSVVNGESLSGEKHKSSFTNICPSYILNHFCS